MKVNNLLFIITLTTISLNAQILDNGTSNNQLMPSAMISVTIGGDFPITGTFPAAITERVDQFVTRLYLEAKDKSMRVTNDQRMVEKINTELNNFSLRGITLRRATGEEIKVDLQKFRITGNFKDNPYLKNDDVIIFPANDMNRNFFTIYGAVNNPGIFFFVEGDSLSDALELSMGLNPSFENISKAVVSRVSYDGETLVSDTIDIHSKYKLHRGDQIQVLAPDNRRKNYHVLILGEVKNPGSYPITYNKTTLYEVIQKAGGFTNNASLRRARLYTGNSLAVFLEKQYGIKLADQPDLEDVKLRNTIVNIETMLMYRMSNVYPEDSSYFFLENQLRVLMEGSSLDFTRVEDKNSDIANYVLKSGDVIIIPSIKQSVYVFGQVARPGNITFVKGKNYKYYLHEAGGIGELAEEDEIMVIKGGSRHWISPINNEVTIEEGDYIYVPKQRLISFRAHAAEYAIYVGMLASISTVILLLITAFK